MSVAELIEQLKKAPPDAPVVLDVHGYHQSVKAKAKSVAVKDGRVEILGME